MLEISKVNYNNPNSVKAKNVAFKNNPQAAAPLAPVATVPTTSLKHIINLTPDSYLDEIGGLALASAGVALSRGKNKKFNQKLAEMAENNSALQKTVDAVKDTAQKAVNEAKDAVKGLVSNDKFEQRLADTSNGLKREIREEALNRASQQINDAKTAMGLEADQKIASKMGGIQRRLPFFTEDVEVNGAHFRLATILPDSKGNGVTQANLEKQLRAEAAKRIMGIGAGWKKVPEHGDIAIVTSEFKGFASTGGMSAVPKDIADNLVKMIDKSGQDVTTTVYMPLYRGNVEAERFRYIRRNEDGIIEYVERAKNKQGGYDDSVIAQLEKVHEMKRKIITDNESVLEPVDVYMSKQLVELPNEFDKRFAQLPKEMQDKFNALEPKGELDAGKLVFSKDKDGKPHVSLPIKAVFLDNGEQGKFDLNVAKDKATTIYNGNALSSGETERFMYFDKFLYELFTDQTRPSKKLRDPSLILGNDWQVGGLVSMMRLLTPVKKAYGEIHADFADRLYNTPVITILHNATLSGGSWHSQEKLLNVLYGDKAATIVKNAHIKMYKDKVTPDMSNRLWNGLLEGNTANNNEGVGVSPQVMAATYSDYVIPVSKNYTEEIADKFVFGRERRQLFEIRAKKNSYGSSSVMKEVAKENGIENFDEHAIVEPTLKGITNGCDTSKNTLTAAQIKKIEKWLGIEEGKLLPYRPDMNALEWHNHNKLVGIEVLKRDTKDPSNPMKIFHPEKVDLSDITVDTPIFVSAGRITDQKGIDLWADSIVEFYKKYKGDNPPVFYLQGIKQTPEDQRLIDAFMKAKEEVEKTNPKAAKRMLYAGLFSEAGRFDMAKIFSDFSVMPSWFEPCGLSHKEIAKFSGAVPVVNKTGGLMDGLIDGVSAFAADFHPDRGDFGSALYKKTIAENANFFADAMLKAEKCYREQPQEYGKMVDTLLKKRFDWAAEGGPIYEYTTLMEKLGVLTHDTATAKIM